MSTFDFDRFNGFMRESLDNLLFEDLWSHYVFNESDLHSAAYFYIRKYFEKNDRHNIYVRCEPKLAGMRPDIVVFDEGKPIYVIEFKFYSKQDVVNEDAIDTDLNKLSILLEKYDSMKWGFFYMVHDGEDSYTISDPSLRRRGFQRVSFSTINMRRKEGSDRRRTKYDEWRMQFDRLLDKHRDQD